MCDIQSLESLGKGGDSLGHGYGHIREQTKDGSLHKLHRIVLQFNLQLRKFHMWCYASKHQLLRLSAQLPGAVEAYRGTFAHQSQHRLSTEEFAFLLHALKSSKRLPFLSLLLRSPVPNPAAKLTINISMTSDCLAASATTMSARVYSSRFSHV